MRAALLLWLLLFPGAVRSQAPASPPAQADTGGQAEPASPLGPALGGLAGCAACGVVPDGIAVGGVAIFFIFLDAAATETTCNACFLTGGALLFGLLPAAIASAVAGPLVPIGAGAGAAVGAALAGRPIWPALVGAIPGLLIGSAGSALTLVFFGRATDPGESARDPRLLEQPLSVWLLGLGMLTALAAGPLAAAGAAGADLLLGDAPAEPGTAPLPETAGGATAPQRPTAVAAAASGRRSFAY